MILAMNASNYFNVTRKVTLVNASTNLFLALVKIIAGWLGLSHALVADGLHSLSDLVSDGVVYLAAKMGSQSPDDDHPYGHRRIETLGAIIIAVVLVAVGALIVLDALLNLSHGHSHPTPDKMVLYTAIASIILNELLYQYSYYHGKKINSPLLLSNAWHNRSDALTSVIVVAAVVGSYFHIPHLDLSGACVIGLLILLSGSKMIWSCFRELIDTAADNSVVEQIQSITSAIPGVVAVHQLRTRSLGGEIFADLHIQVDPRISVSEGHYIADHVYGALIKAIDHLSDVTVHIDPEDDETQKPCADLPDRPSLLKQLEQCWQHLPHYTDINSITLHYYDGKIDLDIVLNTQADYASLPTQYRESLAPQLSFIQHIRFYTELTN